MTRIVMKFGGTSVANIERITRVAELVEREAAGGAAVAVVVSAMAGETNRLVQLCKDAGAPPPEFQSVEHDAVVSSGEQVTAGLLAQMLQARGRRARSWQGWQIPLKTDEAHGRARIRDIESGPLGAAVDSGEIAVIAGFQGIAPNGRVATLGRGGSDTTAVAIAAALDAERCDIYTDVDGVYTTDPRIVKQARKIDKISFEEMLELASLGAKVLQTRSVELAMARGVRLRVLSSFVKDGAPNEGTLVVDEEEIMEKQIVSGVAYSRDDAKVTLLGVESTPGRAARIFTALAEANINVDMIVQSDSREKDAANILFSCKQVDVDRTVAALEALRGEVKFDQIVTDDNVAMVSVVGLGMKSHAGVAGVMFRALAEKGVNIQAISTSEIKISVLVESEYTELAVRALHAAYGLDVAAA